MGWFDEQIKNRISRENDMLLESYEYLDAVVGGNAPVPERGGDRSHGAVEDILRFYRIKSNEAPASFRSMDERLEYLLRPSGIMRRSVELKDAWYRDGIGPLLAQTKDGASVALLPRSAGGYYYTDRERGTKVRVTRANAGLFAEQAICFYAALPARSITMKDLLAFIAQTLRVSDYLFVAFTALLMTLISMLLPYVNSLIFSVIIPTSGSKLLASAAALVFGAALSGALLTVSRTLFINRISTKMDIASEAAAMSRLLSLPTSFFSRFNAGELASRAQGVKTLCSQLAEFVFTTGITSVFSLAYIVQINTYAPSLTLCAVIVNLLSLIISIISTVFQVGVTKSILLTDAKLSGMSFAMYTGVAKIKLAGAERRAFARWSRKLGENIDARNNEPLMLRIAPAINNMVLMFGTLAIYSIALANGVAVSDYVAFGTAYGMFTAGVTALGTIIFSLSQIKPVLEMVEPILKAKPEVAKGKNVVTRLTGSVELNNVTFRYTPDAPNVLDNVSLKIRPGQYVAIVGPTGCGKSTLLRIMLGFETPQKGAVYYDGRDLQSVDLKSLRERIGVVLQDSRLFNGDIYGNVTVSSPGLGENEVWTALEAAGLAQDVREMPLGLKTMIPEGTGGVSGGQLQRLMLARALAPKPRILMLDEATSALDNIKQREVFDSLSALKCTRIIIAHRLSTIKNCDRIIVLNKGVICEDGTYDELVANNGIFAELVRRQQASDIPLAATTAEG